MPEGASETVLLHNAGTKPWLAALFLVPLAILLVTGGVRMLDAGWTPSTGRISFLGDWPPPLRGTFTIGLGCLLGVLGAGGLRPLLEPYRARLCAWGLEFPTLLGRERIAWSALSRVITGGLAGQSIGFRCDGAGFRTTGIAWLPTKGLDRPQEDILRLIARYRADLLPGIAPLEAPPRGETHSVETASRTPQAPIVVDARSWTG